MNPKVLKLMLEGIEAASDAGIEYLDLTPAQAWYIAEPAAGRAKEYLQNGLNAKLQQAAYIAEQQERREFASKLQDTGDNDRLMTGALLNAIKDAPPYIKREVLSLKVMEDSQKAAVSGFAYQVGKGLEPLRTEL